MQEQVTQNRNVVIDGDGVVAGGTVRGRPSHRLLTRQPVNADVQETTDHRAEQQHHEVEGHGYACSNGADQDMSHLSKYRY